MLGRNFRLGLDETRPTGALAPPPDLYQVDAHGAAATLREDLEISPGLRPFDHAEGVGLSG